MSFFIDTVEALSDFEKLVGENISIIYFDTEFHRRNTYWAELCLMQVKINNHIALIDTKCISLKNTFLETAFADSSIIKVCHACEQDLNVLKHYEFQIENCFDTQIAASFCKIGHGLAYQTLVSKLLNINLDKAYQDALWNKRPLTDDMLEYAMHDVKHLDGLFKILKEKLEKLGRLQWVNDEVENVRYQTKKRTMLQLWRENIAKKINVPAGWVLNNKIMHRLSCDQVLNQNEIKQILPDGLKKHSQEVFDIIQATPKNKERVDSNIQNTITILIKILALQENIPPNWLCDNESIRFISIHKKIPHSLYGWRKELLHDTINDFFQGNASICYKNDDLRIQSSV